MLLAPACAGQPDSALLRLGLITPTPTPDPFFHYRAALQPAAQNDIELAGPLARYHISARLAESGDSLTGVMQVRVPSPGPELVFRLYPNLDNYGGSMQVTTAQINETPVQIAPLAGGAAIRLETPVLGDGNSLPEAAVKLNFKVQLPRQTGSNYTLFGWDGPVLSLPGFYPTLAVWQGGDWVLDQPP